MSSVSTPVTVCLALTRAISAADTPQEIYEAALDALAAGLGVARASILLFDPDGVMRFKAARGLSERYRRAVEGHSPWRPDAEGAAPIVVADVREDPSLATFLPTIEAEGIAAMAFIPLLYGRRVIGKFMLYAERPCAPGREELALAELIASQVAFAVVRTRAVAQARTQEERLRFTVDAASIGTWEWDLRTGEVRWSPELERLHGREPGSFDGTFASYEREIHPDDRARVLASTRRTIEDGGHHEVEYRIVTPGGEVRWLEGKGRVEYDEGTPARMCGVCMNITARKEAELARLSAAEESSRLKDEFLAVLSHELRTPLNAILGWVQILAAAEPSPERVRQAMEVIGRNARLQAKLIEDILDVSRIINGKLEVERAPLLLAQLIDGAVDAVRPAADRKRLRWSFDVADRAVTVDGDARRLAQVLGNVLSNAVKFTPEGGAIAVRCAVEGDRAVVEVRDTGAGVSAEFLPFMFDRFRQADGGGTRRHGGLGLGLSIARYLTEAHGGEITAQSAGEGKGTTVTLRLPVAWPCGACAEVEAPTDGDGELGLRGSRVVVVDDHDDARELIVRLLDGSGAGVVACGSAAEALRALGEGPAGLLIADLAMPETDGYTLIEAVRRTHPTLPSLAVSAHAREEDRRRALEAGFDAYCAKPLETRAFLRLVREVVAR